MVEKTGKEESLTEKLFGSPIGSPESRAAARALVENPAVPVIIVELVGALRNADGPLIGRNRNFNRATVEGKTLVRGESETLPDFEARVTAELPACPKFAASAIMFIDDEPSAA